MKKLSAYLLFYLLLTSLVSAQTFKGLPFKKYYNAREYKGGIQNRAITQNTNGLIYIANNFGLLEFDGTVWRRYVLPKETKVRDVTIGSSGQIYIASQGDFGYFTPNEQNQLTFISLADSLPKEYRNFDETWKVFSHQKQTIFCTFNHLFIFENNRLIDIISPKTESVNFFYVNNSLFLNSIEDGLSRFNNYKLEPFHVGDQLTGKFVTGLIPFTNGQLWISTLNSGIFIYDGKNLNVWNPSINNALAHTSINTSLRLRNGAIALGSQNDGLFIISQEGEILMHINKDEGLNNRTILSLHEDNLGNLWVGHNNGLTLLELNLPFTTIDEYNGLPGTGYDGLQYNDKIYLGTNNGLYIKSKNDNTASFEFIEGTEGQVYTVENLDNLILMGHHQGTFLIEDNTATLISDELGAWTFLKPKNHPDYVIGGTYKGLTLYKRQGNSLKFIRKLKGFSESSRVMEQDEEGNIWMTHGYKGAYKIKLNEDLTAVTYQFYNSENGFPSNILINVWSINNRLIFSSETQIFKYDIEKDYFVVDEFFAQYFDKNARISYLEQDAIGNIYFLAENDMGVLEIQPDGAYVKNNTLFNRLKTHLNDDLQKLKVLDINKVLYAAKEGFILYSKDDYYNSNVNYKTLIRSVAVITNGIDSTLTAGVYGGNSLHYSQPATHKPVLAHEHNSIRIEYSAPFIHTDDEIQYQFQLKGLDKNWSEWTAKTDKEYTNLREGKYSFEVRAKNTYGIISEMAVYKFAVLPPWYRSTWAFLGYALLIMTALGSVYYLLDKRHKHEKRLLSLSKQMEINKKESALRSSEEEVQRLRNDKLVSEVENKNKELATSTMLLLNKNSFINSVKHNISTIIKRSKNQEVKKELSKIMTNIDKNIAQDHEWEQFAIHFDQVHGDFTKRIKQQYPDLTPQEMKLSAYLRMNLSTKEIAHLLNISVRGVEIARYRLRKRLLLDRQTNLQEFILKY